MGKDRFQRFPFFRQVYIMDGGPDQGKILRRKTVGIDPPGGILFRYAGTAAIPGQYDQEAFRVFLFPATPPLPRGLFSGTLQTNG